MKKSNRFFLARKAKKKRRRAAQNAARQRGRAGAKKGRGTKPRPPFRVIRPLRTAFSFALQIVRVLNGLLVAIVRDDSRITPERVLFRTHLCALCKAAFLLLHQRQFQTAGDYYRAMEDAIRNMDKELKARIGQAQMP